MTWPPNNNTHKQASLCSNEDSGNANPYTSSNAHSAKSRSNAKNFPSIALSKAGGANKSIDEKFSVNVVNGAASYSIPLLHYVSREKNGISKTFSIQKRTIKC